MQQSVKKVERKPLLKDEYAYFILDEIRVENQKGKGWTLEDHECWGIDGFPETAQMVLKKKNNLCATFQPGASKCNIKKLNEIYFMKEEFRASIFYGKVLQRFENGMALFLLENIQLKNKESTSSKGTQDAKDLEDAIYTYLEYINITFDKKIVGVYGKYAQRITWKHLTDCETDDVEGVSSLIIGRELK